MPRAIAATPAPAHDNRALRYAACALVAIAFVTGGSSQQSGWGDAFAQLLALPVLVLAAWHIARQPASTLRSLALLTAALIALIPLLQLLPIPAELWNAPEARQALARDLAAIGIVPEYRWTLAPAATERAFLMLLPGLAVFVAMLATGIGTHRAVLRLIMLLALLSLMLAFVQLGVPQDSVLNLFPQWVPKLNGVFANPNHQATALVVAIAIALAGMIQSLRHVGEGRRQAWTPWVLGFTVLFMLCALPLIGSRAGVIVVAFAIAVVPLAMGVFRPERLRASRWARAGLLVVVALLALGLWATVGWMQVDAVDELRAPLRTATTMLGHAHAPLGTGIGGFVPAFEQDAPDSLLLYNYINHAHNEYAQWWMEAGWLAVLAGAMLLLVFALSIGGFKARGEERVVVIAGFVGLAAILVHSSVDYPLRTASLTTVAAALAGIVVAQAIRTQRHGQLATGAGGNDAQVA